MLLHDFNVLSAPGRTSVDNLYSNVVLTFDGGREDNAVRGRVGWCVCGYGTWAYVRKRGYQEEKERSWTFRNPGPRLCLELEFSRFRKPISIPPFFSVIHLAIVGLGGLHIELRVPSVSWPNVIILGVILTLTFWTSSSLLSSVLQLTYLASLTEFAASTPIRFRLRADVITFFNTVSSTRANVYKAHRKQMPFWSLTDGWVPSGFSDETRPLFLVFCFETCNVHRVSQVFPHHDAQRHLLLGNNLVDNYLDWGLGRDLRMEVRRPKQIPMACHLISYDQRFLTHIDFTWKIRHPKQIILAKCLSLPFDPREAAGVRPLIPIAFAPGGSERPASPIKFASVLEVRKKRSAGEGGGGGGVEQGQWQGLGEDGVEGARAAVGGVGSSRSTGAGACAAAVTSTAAAAAGTSVHGAHAPISAPSWIYLDPCAAAAACVYCLEPDSASPPGKCLKRSFWWYDLVPHEQVELHASSPISGLLPAAAAAANLLIRFAGAVHLVKALMGLLPPPSQHCLKEKKEKGGVLSPGSSSYHRYRQLRIPTQLTLTALLRHDPALYVQPYSEGSVRALHVVWMLLPLPGAEYLLGSGSGYRCLRGWVGRKVVVVDGKGIGMWVPDPQVLLFGGAGSAAEAGGYGGRDAWPRRDGGGGGTTDRPVDKEEQKREKERKARENEAKVREEQKNAFEKAKCTMASVKPSFDVFAQI
ncbi:hypothetical protein GALMADRAFT_147691 [Galerina marginata CBS 339.88]|uniref:Uncharacterized protein n=1 Tax=Galerina marginata (strain CBS 339.88) TaxID=685588 RepID=A0A067SFY0_GALM3|nr:hypothetical protein GALMADRAFT_147691 [Galerina marginata CBS 339.88]